MAASKELKDIIKNLNQEHLKEYVAEMGMEWHFTTTDVQLMAANKELKDIIKNPNQEQLKEYGPEMKME